MKTLLVSALFLVACKSEKPAPAEAPKPVEPKPQPAAIDPEIGSDGLTDSERRKMAAADELTAEEMAAGEEMKFPESEAATSALAELGAAEDLGSIIDPTSTFGFADRTVTPPVTKELCGLSNSKDGLVVRSKLEGFRARIAKAAADGNINCGGFDNNRVECELNDKGTPNLTFMYAYEMDAARLVGFGIDTLDNVKDMGAKVELSKSLRTRGGNACNP